MNHDDIIEYILYQREHNRQKTWGHIRGYSTIFSYCRWNTAYDLFPRNIESIIDETDDFGKMVIDWYHGNFEKKYLENYGGEKNYLYNFIYAISVNKTHSQDYYFKFSETIDTNDLKYLLLSFQQNPHYLFTNIALGSYYFHTQKLDLASRFYLNALKIDKNNPRVSASISQLYGAIGGEKNLIEVEKIMKNLSIGGNDEPWVFHRYGEALNKVGKYLEALSNFKKYEKITEGKHRTFEPFLMKSESYIGLGDFKKAREELEKEKLYYLGEGYRFVYNDFDEKLKKLGY